MTKRTLWYVCLGLLCCLALAVVVNAAAVNAGKKAPAAVNVGNKALPQEGVKAASSASTRIVTAVPPASTSASAVPAEQVATKSLARNEETRAIEREIAALKAQLLNTAQTDVAVPMNIKLRLNELYSQLPINQRSNPLDQGNDACPATVIPSVPYNDTGTTTGMVNDYSGTCVGSGAPDVIYEFTPTVTDVYTISLCGSSYDTGLYVKTTGACPGSVEVACNDDFCGLQSEITTTLTASVTYWFIVDGWSSNAGAYVLNVTQYVPPVLECPPGATLENEPVCADEYVDNYNGGCNSAPPIFQPINCGETICGQSGTFLFTGLQYRDTDWFELVLATPQTVTWTVTAEFSVLIFTIGSPCPGTIRLSNSGGPLTPVTIVDNMPAGTYYLWVGPSVFTGVPCGSDWVGTVTCVPYVEPIGRCCYNGGANCADNTQTQCTALGGQWNDALDCTTPCPLTPHHDACQNAEVIPSFPYVDTDDNTAATVDCAALGYREVWYTFTITAACDLTISYCGTTPAFTNVFIVLDTSCPCSGAWTYYTSYTVCADGNYEITWAGLVPGTYYAPILTDVGAEGPYTVTFTCGASPIGRCCYGDPTNPSCADNTAGECTALGGVWDGTLTCATPCPICDVVSTGTPEGEDCTDPDDYNGGCNSTPNIFQNIECGAHIAGTAYFDGATRDTDWYQLVGLIPNDYTLTVTAEFDLQLLILYSLSGPISCSNYTYVLATGGPCQTLSLSTGPQPAGTFWFWVGPQFTNTFACLEYDMVVTSASPCTCDPVTDLTVLRGLNALLDPNVVNLRWYATQNFGLYRVFGTTDKNNDGDPDNGTDPQWSLVTELPAPAIPGYMTTSDTPLVPYMNYVVVHDCAPRGRCCYGDPLNPSCTDGITEEACTLLGGTFGAGLSCPCPSCADFVLAAPGSVSGNTTGAGDNCALRAGDEQIVAVTIPTAGQWTFSLCNTSPAWDTYIYLTTACCGGTTLASDDDACPYPLSRITCVQLDAGTYYLDIEPYSSGTTGAWTLDVIFCEPPPPLECPPGATLENEPVCGAEYVDATNGGCNSTPNVFQPISCGETICGESGTFLFAGGNYRDTDWFELVLTQPMTVTWSVQSAFDLLIFTIDSPCPGTIRQQANAAPMGVATIVDVMNAGTYYLWVGPSVFTGVPCGTDWVGTVTCVPSGGAYCPAGSSYCDEYIDNVTLNTISNPTSCTAPGYADYTAISTTLDIGTPYTLTAHNPTAYCPDDSMFVWVDWGNDFTFDATDFVPTTTSDCYTYTGTVTPPSGSSGTHRMRIRMSYFTVRNPCGTETYGEVEDYTIIVP